MEASRNSDLEGKSAKLKINFKMTSKKSIGVRDISNLPALCFESKKKLRRKEEEEEEKKREKQHSTKRRQRPSRFDVKPEQKAENDDERMITLSANNIGPYLRIKGPAECNDEELIKSYCDDLIFGPIDMETALKEAPTLRKYLIQVEASQGFDIDDWPNLNYIPMCAPYPAQRSPQCDERYLMLARYALENYNETNGTEFQVDQLVKVNRAIRSYYLITFKVKNPANTFQAEVSQTHVSICRPKPNVQ